MSSTGFTPKPVERPDRHLVVKLDDEAIAITTLVKPSDAINSFYVLAVGGAGFIMLQQVDCVTRDTLLAFGSVPELTPTNDGRMVDITPLLGDTTGKQSTLFSFGV